MNCDRNRSAGDGLEAISMSEDRIGEFLRPRKPHLPNGTQKWSKADDADGCFGKYPSCFWILFMWVDDFSSQRLRYDCYHSSYSNTNESEACDSEGPSTQAFINQRISYKAEIKYAVDDLIFVKVSPERYWTRLALESIESLINQVAGKLTAIYAFQNHKMGSVTERINGLDRLTFKTSKTDDLLISQP